jgi:hypothetical protein
MSLHDRKGKEMVKKKSRHNKQKTKHENMVHPSCSFQSRLDTFNKIHMFNDEPITYEQKATESLIPYELRPSINLRDPANSKKLVTRHEKNSLLFRNNDQISIHSPKWLAQIGFYYTPLSIKHKYSITCISCNQLIRDPIPLNIDIIEYHLNEHPTCALSLIYQFKNKIPKNNEIWKVDSPFRDINSDKCLNIRRQTFKYWKFDFPNIEDMISTGLYYDPLNDIGINSSKNGDDRVICMYCGLHLQQWEKVDVPSIAHKEANPTCWVFNYFEKEKQQENQNYEIDQELPDFGQSEGHVNSDFPENNGIAADHSIISITTTATTTLPVEIISQDEIEEFLSNSERQNELIGSNAKIVEIPSMKSSELSQFFTELDNEDANENGASYFNDSRRKRREKQKEQIEKLMSQVDPIVEESISENNALPIYEMDDFAIDNVNIHESPKNADSKPFSADYIVPDYDQNASAIEANYHEMDEKVKDVDPEEQDQQLELIEKNMDDIEKISRIENEEEELNNEEDKQRDKGNINEQNRHDDEKIITPFENAHYPEDADELNVNKNCTIIADDHDGKRFNDPFIAKDPFKEVETSRVEQLETELKLLKKQIELLQNINSQQLINKTSDSISKINTNDNSDNNNKNESMHTIQDTYNGEVNDENISIHLANSLDVVDIEKIEPKNTNTEAFQDKDFTEKAEVKIEYSADKSNKPKKSKKKSRLKKSKRKYNDEEEEEEEEEEEHIKYIDPLSLPSLKKLKKRKRDKIKKRKIKVEPEEEQGRIVDDLVVLELPNLQVDEPAEEIQESKLLRSDDSIKMPVRKQNKKPVEEPVEGSFENKSNDKLDISNAEIDKKDTSEVPTQIDKTPHPISDDDEILIDNVILPSSEPKLEPYRNEKVIESSHGKHETSPTLMRKNARVSSITKSFTGDNKTLYVTLDKLMNQGTHHETGKLDKEFEVEVEADGEAEAEAEEEAEEEAKVIRDNLIIGSDVLNNQSTPYAHKTNDVKLSEIPAMGELKENVFQPTTTYASKNENGDDVKRNNNMWIVISSEKYKEFYRDIHEATGYVKEVLDSPYDLLGDDLDGMLTEFVAEIPADQLKMTIREWILFQEEQAVGLVLDKADEMMQQFRLDQQKTLAFLEGLREN